MKRVGRAGPICRRAFARPYKLMVIGNYSFWIAQAGISKGRKTDAAADVVMRGLSRKRAATCPRLPALRSFDRRLIPRGASTDGGSDPSLCADEAHQFGSNLETRSRPQGVDRGAGLSKRRPALVRRA